MNQEAQEIWRSIGWNALTADIPSSWEITVSGPFHLLMEHRFQPVLEIRWQREARRPMKDIVGSIHRSFRKQLGRPVREIVLPAEFEKLVTTTGARGLSWRDDGAPSGVIWHCPVCDSVIFCHLCSDSVSFPWTDAAQVLASIRCHSQREKTLLWAIQDFRLVLPATMKLTDYTLAAGLTSLVFKDRRSRHRFCRLAPADHRLAAASLPQLLANLGGKIPDAVAAIEAATTHERWNTPCVMTRVLQRLRRKMPFHWSRIWHDQSSNRLLAVLVDSARPIDRPAVHTLCRHYEIVPIPQTAAATKQS